MTAENGTYTAKDYKQAMDDLRKGEITADEFRAYVHASKAANGQSAHDSAKFSAIAASNSVTPNELRKAGTMTITLEPWQAAETRRQLYMDLKGLAEHIADEAHHAAEMRSDDPAARGLGEDMRAFCHKIFADAVTLLDVVGWDVGGDTDLLLDHGKGA